MGVLNIRKAERAGARLVIGLAGISGSGKTYTALQLAWGLAGFDASKVGLLDTENRRGSLYANSLRDASGKVHQFLVGDLDAPFSPERYIDAIQEFQAAGVQVLVIDSVTHEFEGIGGLDDIANAGNPRNPRWNDAKARHKKFMNAMLQCDMHIIACMRAREKVKIVKRDGRTEYEPQGVLPIQEKNFVFELTASLMMWGEGKQQQVMKCPAELRDILGREDGYITAQDGAALRAWVDGGVPVNTDAERARNMLRMATEQGMAALQAAWKSLPAATRKAISPTDKCPDELKRAAQSFDEQRAESQPGGADLANLNAQVLGGNSERQE
jgi:hypothetical protein